MYEVSTTPVGARPVVGTQALQHFQAIDLRQIDVEQHDLRRVAQIALGVGSGREQIVERFLPVSNHDDLVADVRAPERDQRQLFVVGIVLGKQDDRIRHLFFSHNVK